MKGVVAVSWGAWIFLAVSTPLYGLVNNLVECNFGYTWEVHTVVLVFVCLYRNLELMTYYLFYAVVVDVEEPDENTFQYQWNAGVGFLAFMAKFCFGVATMIDGYTDNTFIVIAYVCGSKLWLPAALFYLVGVLGLQYLAAPMNNWKYGKSLGGIMMTPACMTAVTMDILSELASQAFESASVDDVEVILDDKETSRGAAAIGRCICEDLAQGCLQLIFVFYFKWSPFVVFSVALGMALSFTKGVLGCVHALSPDGELLARCQGYDEAGVALPMDRFFAGTSFVTFGQRIGRSASVVQKRRGAMG